jgi:minor extracellular serine protease Vpr
MPDPPATLASPLRPGVVVLAVAAALAAALPAAAELQPIRRSPDYPRVRAGTVRIPAGHASGRVQVIVRLPQPALATYRGRTLMTLRGARRLSVTASASQAYLRRLAAVQEAAVSQLRRTIPQARVERRFRIVLNALAVDVPASRLPALVNMPFAAHVYPSLRYTQSLNTSTSLIGATAIQESSGTRGDGMKIAIVDDGIDRNNVFFNPGGFSYPAGFPKGNRTYTTPKVIVAKAFFERASGKRGRLPYDPRVSFHGTHVAGIAAGDAGTTAPAGDDHPTVTGLSGVAPRAQVGSYRVFTIPTPFGWVGNSPEIIAAFEAAVADGMDVINFSGGGSETEPSNDALLKAIDGVVAAGVLPVIAAGNSRDEFGVGSAESPGSSPSALTVAAASNTHVFGSFFGVTAASAPDSLRTIAMLQAPGDSLTRGGFERTLVDVGTVMGTDGRPVDRLLCGPEGNVNSGRGTLPSGSLSGSILLVSRGVCTFVSKSERARLAGAAGIILVDNRPGEANPIPIRLSIPGAMIADLDGARLRAYLADTGGRATIRIQQGPAQIPTGRSGILTSFSSAGPTSFGHDLKPDITAPGGQILSATSQQAGGPFAVFDGTSMATPHIAGAVALLLERHPSWSPAQVKSALMATAGPAWADTARTREAPVIMQGGGLANIVAADNPLVFTSPASLSFSDLDASRNQAQEARPVVVADAGGGSGTWQVELRPQAASAGAHVDLPAVVEVGPGGETQLSVTARADAGAERGENYGFVVLRRGDVVRRIPYFFLVIKPAFADAPVRTLRASQRGDTRRGTSRTSIYRYPAAPFGPAPNYFGAPMEEDGAEQVYRKHVTKKLVNFGAAVVFASSGSAPDPWLLGSRDENSVRGEAGTPVNVNNYMLDYRADIGAAAAVFPVPADYYLVVDSGRDPFTNKSLAGSYVLRSWVNDVRAPRVVPLTVRVAAGRPTLAVRVLDGARGSGVDPLSLIVGYRNALVGAAAFDPPSGIAVFPLPDAAPKIRRGRTRVTFSAADYQETKNLATPHDTILPNTRYRRVSIRGVLGPAVSWLTPAPGGCVGKGRRLLVLASSTARVRSVRFLDGKRTVAVDRSGTAGLFAVTWRGGRRRAHELHAIAVDARGHRAEASLRARTCK